MKADTFQLLTSAVRFLVDSDRQYLPLRGKANNFPDLFFLKDTQKAQLISPKSLGLILAAISFGCESTLLQYIGDLLLGSPSEEACLTNSLHLLHNLASKEHKTSKEKLQFSL